MGRWRAECVCVLCDVFAGPLPLLVELGLRLVGQLGQQGLRDAQGVEDLGGPLNLGVIWRGKTHTQGETQG